MEGRQATPRRAVCRSRRGAVVGRIITKLEEKERKGKRVGVFVGKRSFREVSFFCSGGLTRDLEFVQVMEILSKIFFREIWKISLQRIIKKFWKETWTRKMNRLFANPNIFDYDTTLDTIETRTLPALVAGRSEEGWRKASQVQSPGSKDERERKRGRWVG